MIGGGWCSPRLADLSLDAVTWVIVDTETSGLDPNADELREVAGLVVDARGRQLDAITWRAADGATARAEAIGQIVDRLACGATLVAHNVAFDLAFLSLEPAWKASERWLCTMRMSGSRASLDALAARVGVEVLARHTAIGDATTLARVVVALTDRVRQRGLRSVAGLAVVCPVVTGADPPLSTSLAHWDGVRATLDLVAPTRFPDRRLRQSFRALVSSLPAPETGPVNPGEHVRVVAALEQSGIDALTLDLLLADLDLKNSANSDNLTGDT